MKVTCSTALPPSSSLLYHGKALSKAMEFMQRAIDITAYLGGNILCGPLHHPVGEYPDITKRHQLEDTYCEAMQKLGIYAKERNIKLGIEILNRFETSFLNTAEQAIHLCEKIQNPNVGLHLDPFHMNIEEKDPLMAIKRAKGYLFHFHISENDRGIIRQGNINWKTS